ncbi:hypothetical protein AVEN_97092-1 [Araneus ventricosus]|uniref:Uncharacterized protein n=1 Tax=Araneus ventricosus TaxID=182803 RepID=A0A4Y2EH55_ARAVE|nr:hypothetical protein AVEN_97092-1 [Araneus ventricosus]
MSTSDGFINGRSLRQASMYNWSFLAGALRNQCSTSDSGESGEEKGREVKPESIINLDFPVHGTLPQQELATMASLCSCAVTNLPCNGCCWMMKRFRGTLTREQKSHFVVFHCVFILGSGFCPLTRLKNPSFRVHRRGQRVGLLPVGRFLNSGTEIAQTHIHPERFMGRFDLSLQIFKWKGQKMQGVLDSGLFTSFTEHQVICPIQ